jgi:magnesium transporter
MAVLPSLPSLPSFVPSVHRRPAQLTLPIVPRDVIVDCAAYIDGVRVPGCHDPLQAIDMVRGQHRGFVWIGLHEPDTDEMAEVAKLFGLHELAVEDAVHAYQRPKLDRYSSSLFLVLKTVCYVDHQTGTDAVQIVENGEIMLFLGKDFIVSVRHGSHSQLTGVRARLEADPEQLAIGPAAVMHAIADRIVDEYVTVIEQVEDDVDEMENAVFTTAKPVDIEQIYLLTRKFR